MPPHRELALITGASSGIGAEMARQLAAQQHNLVLTARRRERLESLAAELSARHGIQATVIDVDLNEAAGPQQLVERLTALQLAPSILINNAGLGSFLPFVEQPVEHIEAMLNVDIRALTLLARLVGSQMADRGQGSILNVASFAGLAPVPGYTVYSAAKAYVIAFTQALRHELAPRGVNVSVVCPGFTPTEFFDVSHHQRSRLMRLTELTVEQVARAAIRGLQRRQFLIVPGWWYKLNRLTAALAPGPIVSTVSDWMVR